MSDYLLWLSEKDESDCKFVSFSPDQFNGLWQLHLLNGNVVREVGCQCVWRLFLWRVCVAGSAGPRVVNWFSSWRLESTTHLHRRIYPLSGSERGADLAARALSLIGWAPVPPPSSPPMRDENRWSVAWRAPDGPWRVAKLLGGVYCAQNRARTAAELKYRLLCNLPDL